MALGVGDDEIGGDEVESWFFDGLRLLLGARGGRNGEQSQERKREDEGGGVSVAFGKDRRHTDFLDSRAYA
uniref:Uncharacterized protein n=1 Tax=mine drainage metagenome TaxID=410659 RepID=E6PYJ9_9ZZZZ